MRSGSNSFGFSVCQDGPVNSNDTADDHGDAPHHSAPARISWARLPKRVFDIEQCPHCGGTLKIIAAIEHPTVIASILALAEELKGGTIERVLTKNDIELALEVLSGKRRL